MSFSCPRPSGEAGSLADREVGLWWTSVAAAKPHRQRLIRLLDDEERRRADRFLVEPARDRFVAGKALLRTVLGRHTGRAPESLDFTYGAHGKPTLSDHTSGPGFNASHAGDVAVIAVTGRSEVGVDVEDLREVNRAESLARRFFTPEESAAVEGAPEDLRDLTFLHIWTCKEALLKATGTGISVALDSVEVVPAPDRPPRLIRVPAGAGPVTDWTLLRATPRQGYLAAVAVRGKGWRVVVRELEL